MKIIIENTAKMVTLETGEGCRIPARVWQGETESGIPVQCYITRIAPEIPRESPRNAEFERELQECADPRRAIEAIPMRFFID